MTPAELALQKAHSAAKHLERMSKAAHSFRNAMHKVVDAHNDDMQAAIGNMAKVMGVDENFKQGGSIDDATPTDITKEGTDSLIDFNKATEVSALLKAMEEKGYKVTAPEVPEVITKATLDEALAKNTETVITTMLKLLTGTHEGVAGTESSTAANGVHKAAPAAGIGDRGQVQEPVRRVSQELEKGVSAPQQAEVQLVPGSANSEALVKRALGGDVESQKQLMKGAVPANLPSTLTEAMSKVH